MDFQLTDEQHMLEDTVDRWVRDSYAFDARAAIHATELGYSLDHWQQLADMGLLGVPFSEAVGGFGGGGVELMVVAQSFGRGLVLEPYLATVVLAGTVLERLGSDSQNDAWLGAIIAGQMRFALACHEPQGRYNPTDIETTATAGGNDYVLNGRKAVVLHGDSADQLVVIARSSGATTDRDGLSAFVVAATADGVTRRGYATIDGLRAAEITLDNVRVGSDALLGGVGAAADALEEALQRGVLVLCAEATGAMEVACAQTLVYVKERKQFGVPIGSFQALQHRMVEMHMALEKARSMTMLAACSLEDGSALCDKRLSAAKAMIGKTGRCVAQESIQLHGGMGMMEETAISHYAKRIIMIDHQLGDLAFHMQRLEAMLEVGDDAA